jgi:nucleoside-diphosphate-sugar epimerase
MPRRLLIDEMYPGIVAEQLCAKGHDVRAVVTDPEYSGLTDETILIGAAEAGRALVTADIKDFTALDALYRASGRSHAGLILVSAKTFPQDHSLAGALTNALSALLNADRGPSDGQVIFLSRQ